MQLQRDERFRERLEAQSTLGNLLFGNHAGLQEPRGIDGEAKVQVERGKPMSEELECRILTMSWWIRVGVRRGVEEAFNGLVIYRQLFAPIDGSIKCR